MFIIHSSLVKTPFQWFYAWIWNISALPSIERHGCIAIGNRFYFSNPKPATLILGDLYTPNIIVKLIY